MKAIKRILFPTDFSEAAKEAFRFTLLLADKLEAEIEVLHVIFPQYEGMDLPVMAAQATQKKVEAAREVLESFVDTSVEMVADELENTADISTDIEIGAPGNTILTIAERDEADLIIMGSHDDHNALEKMLGTITQGVVQKAPCHILVLPAGKSFDTLQTMAFATDLEEADPFRIWEITQLFNAFHPILRIVHVEEKDDAEKPLDMQDLEKYFADRSPALQVNFHQVKGKNLSNSLNEFSETWDVDLLAMASPNRSFWERLFHRSETRIMALNTQTPLLIFREET